ncbi:MAG TPA: LpqB family beta-propeller domain-containing protein [Vicinamibacterales bacterium]|nr:LpqB family beta-propeller domain-containing protein [Vicinamibacterales bacterium]
MFSQTRAALTALLMMLLATPPLTTQSVPGAPLLAEPGISPDGREIVFASGGDIWTAPLGGSSPAIARLLVSHPATETRPLYSPSGNAVAFVSNRTGNGDIYVLRFADATLTRLTFDDAAEVLDGWSRDGKFVLFSMTARDIAGMNDVFRVSVDGGTPMPVTNERYTNEFAGALSPDGRTLAFSARGTASGQWWRRGHSHLDESEIWVATDAAPPASRYRQVVERGAKSLWPMWSGDGKSLYFMSDRSGHENIWHAVLGGAPRQVTKFDNGRVLWPSITADGRTIAFERNFGVWTLDTASGKVMPLQVELRGAPASPAIERTRFTNQFTNLTLSPDGRKVAFIVRGEVFAGPSRDGGDAERVTTSAAREFGLAWSRDSRRLFFVSVRNAINTLVSFDLAARTETVLLTTEEELSAPMVSPDGQRLAYVEGRSRLKIFDVGARQAHEVAQGFLNARIAWSPDSKWLAYVASGPRGFANVSVLRAAGSDKPEPAQRITFLANFNADSLSWSSDGTFLTFVTGQRTEPGQVARVDLVLRTPKFREDRFRSMFDQDTPAPPSTEPPRGEPSRNTSPAAPPASTSIVFDDIRRRLSLLPVGVDALDQTISPDGKTILITANAAGQTNLYTYSIDELAREPAVARQLTSTAGAKTNAQFSPDGKEVYYLEAGRPQAITIDERRVRPLDLTAEMDVDFVRERPVVFHQAWQMLNAGFFDPKHNGVDWAAMRKTYGARVEQARTPDEMRRVTQLMIGELNASHLGFNAPPAAATPPFTGRLGIAFDPAEYARNGRFRIAEILPLGPVAVAGGIRVGDVVVGIDGAPLTATTNIDERLQHTIGRRVMLTVAGGAATERQVAVRPVNLATEKALRYRSWVEDTRALVNKLSGGRLGYAHMIDMSAESLEQLFIDLDAENHAKDGVVIDVRNNNGGFVNVYAIDVLARRSYFDMTRRGDVRVPSRSMLGQRALERPTILVTNQHSLSDAEDFTEGYRAHKLGTVVGEPTAGWIIYTSNQPVMDGSILRVPGVRITATDGSDMEMRPRPVDIHVTRALGESAQGRDTQIETAVKELLRQLTKS